MIDLARLDTITRLWLKRVSVKAIVVLLEAIHDELASRVAAQNWRAARRVSQRSAIESAGRSPCSTFAQRPAAP